MIKDNNKYTITLKLFVEDQQTVNKVVMEGHIMNIINIFSNNTKI